MKVMIVCTTWVKSCKLAESCKSLASQYYQAFSYRMQSQLFMNISKVSRRYGEFVLNDFLKKDAHENYCRNEIFNRKKIM